MLGQNEWKKLGRWANIWWSQFRFLTMKNNRPVNQTADDVIVIKMDAIGDFLIWLDSASQYKKIYKNQRIVLICNTVCEEIAKHTGFFDEIISVQSRRFEADNKYKKEILEKLRKRSFHTLLQTAYSRTIDMDILACCIPAKEKIGFVADESRENLSRFVTFRWICKKLDKIYDKLIPSGEKGLMELERNAVFIRGLGREFKAGYSELPIAQVKEGIIPQKPYVVFFPGSSSEKKMWPIDRFAQIGEYIISKKNMDIYLCGSKDEAYIYENFMNSMTRNEYKERVHNYFGKTTLLELAEVIRHSELIISNDTSGIHFAAAVNTKGICLFGEFAFGRFLPYRCERDCKEHNPIIVCHAGMQCAGCSAKGTRTSACKEHLMKAGKYLCIDEITVEQVLEWI